MPNVSEIVRSMEYAEEQEFPFTDEDELQLFDYHDYPQYDNEQRKFILLGRQ